MSLQQEGNHHEAVQQEAGDLLLSLFCSITGFATFQGFQSNDHIADFFNSFSVAVGGGTLSSGRDKQFR